MKSLSTLLLLFLFIFCSSFSLPKNWVIAGSEPDSYEMGLDKGAGKDGGNAATIQSIAKKIDGFGTLMQQCKPNKYLGKRIRMTGNVKSEEVTGSAGLWLRIDRGFQEVSFDNMYKRPIKGDTDWKVYEIVLDVPPDATNMAFGALLSGTGKIWFDDIQFEVVGKEVKPTSKMNSSEADINSLKEPSNLDFEE